MVAAWIVVALIAAASALYVFLPLAGGPAAARPREDAELLGRARELESRHAMLLASLKDLEDDMRTDKMGERDYAELKARLTADAVETLKALDAIRAERANPPRVGPRPLEGSSDGSRA